MKSIVSYCSDSYDFKNIHLQKWFLDTLACFAEPIDATVIENYNFEWDVKRREIIILHDNKKFLYDFSWQQNLTHKDFDKVLRCNSYPDENSISFIYLMLQREPKYVNEWSNRSEQIYFCGAFNHVPERIQAKKMFEESDLSILFEKPGTMKDYMVSLSGYKNCLSLPGLGDWCWRDMEILSTGGLLIRPKYKINTPLIPWKHYLPLSNNVSNWVDETREILSLPDEQKYLIAKEGRDLFVNELSKEAFRKRVSTHIR